MKFKDMNLAAYIVQGLQSQGIETATEIQEATLPLIKKGADVIGLSQTGSGKTYAFGIPALERINMELSAVQVLIVCPTRELAIQVTDDLRKLTGPISKLGITSIFGGSNMARQIQALKYGAKIVVGTPGRLMDHLRRRTLKLDKLSMVILDEADEMLNMGFKEDIETILKSTPSVTRQTIMFSATMSPEIQKITNQFMKQPVIFKAKNQDRAPTLIKQYYVNCGKTEKADVLGKIYEKFNPWISIVFCNTIRMVDTLCDALKKKGLPVAALHGDMRQNERKRVMESFKKTNGNGILVATDVAARGIDIKNVDVVVNYDFPNDEDYYVHRIGRTGRAGKEGIAFTIINTKNQAGDLQRLVAKTGGKIEEFAELSTTKWPSGSEPKQPRTNKHTNFQQKRHDFKRQQQGGPNHRKDNFKRVIGKPSGTHGTEEFMIGSDAPRFGTNNPGNRRFGSNSGRTGNKPKHQRNYKYSPFKERGGTA